jgi:DNA mismatch repair protein MutS
MRQVALISLMAQMGSFVPAAKAKLPVLDAIYTRIGSSDDLVRGRSTFMVEMSEVARILDLATPQSLILIDEIGRGTSTYDGLSLAWSLLEYLHKETQAKTLFATHFHELTQLEKSLPGLCNGNVLVDRSSEQLVFLYRLAPGVCSQSYGIEVAKLAGLPGKVLSRARDLLGLLETQSQKGSKTRNKALEIHVNQLGLFDESKSPEMPVRIEN